MRDIRYYSHLVINHLTHFRYSVDGNYCMTAGQDKSVKLWNPNKGRPLKTYSGHGYEVLDVRGSCDNSQVRPEVRSEMMIISAASDCELQHGQDHHAVGRELWQLDPQVERTPGDNDNDNDDDSDNDIIRRL